MNDGFRNMIKGLALHYLQRRSVQEAIEKGQQAGVPAELLDSLPGMMFDVTAAAGAVVIGERKFDDVVDQLWSRTLKHAVIDGFSRQDASTLVAITLAFMRELFADGGDDRPVPDSGEPWFEYGMRKEAARRPSGSS